MVPVLFCFRQARFEFTSSNARPANTDKSLPRGIFLSQDMAMERMAEASRVVPGIEPSGLELARRALKRLRRPPPLTQ